MTKEKMTFDWQEMWMQQSKAFFDAAQNNFKEFSDQKTFFDPEKNMQQINEWMEKLKESWQFSALSPEQKAYQTYWQMLTNMYNEAADLMLSQWVKRTQEKDPIKNWRELYELWLNACQEIYQKTLKTQAYQSAYGDFMNAAIKLWQTSLNK